MTQERLELMIPRSQQRAVGQATVEFALVFSFLALLLVGIADVARIYSEHLAVVHAAAVGARWATLDPNYKACSGYTDVGTPVAEDLAGSVQIVGAPIVLTSTNPDAVRVNVTYRHDFLFGMVSNVPSQFTAGATMPGTQSGLGGTCPTPLATPTPTRTSTPVPTPTPQICPLRYSDSYVVRSFGNGATVVYAEVTLVDAQNRPFLGANVTAHITNGNQSEDYVLISRGPGIYGECSNRKWNSSPNLRVTVTATGGGCDPVVQDWWNPPQDRGC